MNKKPIILASQSPRRRTLLESAGIEFTVVPPDEQVEVNANHDLPPGILVVELARLKACAVANQLENALIVAADTVAECEGRILGKPVDRDDAKDMLLWMSGKKHRVLTGVSLWSLPENRHREFLDVTVLQMDSLNSVQLETYLDSENWQGKAGAFGYQDGLDWVHIESGLESNVVGLPIEKLLTWLAEFDV